VSNIYDNILDLIGHTPLIRFHKVETKYSSKANIIGKLEFFNAGFSVKSRIAKNMIEEAEKEGKLKEGDTIIEGTSGNTGIGLAMVAAAKGYKAIIAMPENMSKERIAILKAYGASVELTPAKDNMAGANERVQKLLKENNNVYSLGQGANPANPGIHEKTTGPEIWEDTDGKVDIFIAASGTGGTISGTGRYLKSKNPNIKIIAVEPAGSPVLSGGKPGYHKIQGIGGGLTPPVTDESLFDEIITVTDAEAYEMARFSAKEEGILIGISAGAALIAAAKVAGRPENAGKNIVTIIPDSGERYLTSDLYEI
jgi:cysteine synthase A